MSSSAGEHWSATLLSLQNLHLSAPAAETQRVAGPSRAEGDGTLAETARDCRLAAADMLSSAIGAHGPKNNAGDVRSSTSLRTVTLPPRILPPCRLDH
jgi:hypothetical protein